MKLCSYKWLHAQIINDPACNGDRRNTRRQSSTSRSRDVSRLASIATSATPAAPTRYHAGARLPPVTAISQVAPSGAVSPNSAKLPMKLASAARVRSPTSFTARRLASLSPYPALADRLQASRHRFSGNHPRIQRYFWFALGSGQLRLDRYRCGHRRVLRIARVQGNGRSCSQWKISFPDKRLSPFDIEGKHSGGFGAASEAGIAQTQAQAMGLNATLPCMRTGGVRRESERVRLPTALPVSGRIRGGA